MKMKKRFTPWNDCAKKTRHESICSLLLEGRKCLNGWSKQSLTKEVCNADKHHDKMVVLNTKDNDMGQPCTVGGQLAIYRAPLLNDRLVRSIEIWDERGWATHARMAAFDHFPIDSDFIIIIDYNRRIAIIRIIILWCHLPFIASHSEIESRLIISYSSSSSTRNST